MSRADWQAGVAAAVSCAGWPGVVLPFTRLLDVGCYPVVQFTGAHARLEAACGPVLSYGTVAEWESWDGDFPGAPSAPLQILGVVAAAGRWRRSMDAVRCLSGLGAGMVLVRATPPPLQLLDADASGVWVCHQRRDGSAVSLVTGRAGPVESTHRVALNRHLEEVLFAHALRADAIH